MKRHIHLTCALVLLAAGCAKAPPPVDVQAIEKAAHGGYVDAINTNDTEKLMAVLSDDVVYQAPGAPEIVGKEAVRKWVADYFGAYKTHWDKKSIDFTVTPDGATAYERYTYVSTDIDRVTGATVTDRGKGINVFQRDPGGQWRVAIDGWSSDLPPSR